MRSFRKVFVIVLMGIALLFVGANLYLYSMTENTAGRPWMVEISRLVTAISLDGLKGVELSECEYITGVEEFSGNAEAFYHVDSAYIVREIAGVLYRFDYVTGNHRVYGRYAGTVNLLLVIMTVFVMGILFYVWRKILSPFDRLTDVPYELAKGNLTAPIKENKNRFFGRFLWGVDLLRENIEEQKQRELDLQKEKKTLLLSLSHDIKTPLSAIKLYSQALLKGLYTDKDKQYQVAEEINKKADEIEGYVSRIISASREDFLSLEVNPGEFYLSELLGNIEQYYGEKLALVKTGFSVTEYTDCLLKGDIDRSIEVLQNIMENAVKYGDGRSVAIHISEEDGCEVIAVENSGCTLTETELPHIFESFFRGTNAGSHKGSGLGLYICRKLMHKMNGEIFADSRDDSMVVTVVFSKA